MIGATAKNTKNKYPMPKFSPEVGKKGSINIKTGRQSVVVTSAIFFIKYVYFYIFFIVHEISKTYVKKPHATLHEHKPTFSQPNQFVRQAS